MEGLPSEAWDRVASELRACKEAQQRSWGDIGSAELGRYLAGETAGEERARIEQALDDLPQLRQLTDLVRDVLTDLEPMPAGTDRPAVVRLVAGERRRRVSAWARRYAAVAAAACVLLALGASMPGPTLSPAAPDLPVAVVDTGLAMRSDLPSGGFSLLAMPNHSRPEPLPIARAEPQPAGQAQARARSFFADQAARPPVASLNIRQVNGLYRQSVEYRRRGELNRAEPTLWQVHAYCQSHLGSDHPATQSSALHLASVYQYALNTAYTPAPLPSPSGPAVATHHPTPRTTAFLPAAGIAQDAAGYYPQLVLHTTARLLAERIASKPSVEVQRSVVAVLVQAVKAAPGVEERRACIRALAQLGPSAQVAVGVLVDRLERAGDAGEFRDVLLALEQLGPAARSAVPALARLLQGEAAVNPEQRQMVKGVLARLQGKEGRVGVCDEVGCFSVKALQESSVKLRQLARQSNVEVLVETHSGEPDRNAGARSDLGKRAVHVVIDPAGPDVQVRLSDELRREGVPADQVRQQVLARCRQRQYDRALAEGVQAITRLCPGKEKAK